MKKNSYLILYRTSGECYPPHNEFVVVRSMTEKGAKRNFHKSYGGTILRVVKLRKSQLGRPIYREEFERTPFTEY